MAKLLSQIIAEDLAAYYLMTAGPCTQMGRRLVDRTNLEESLRIRKQCGTSLAPRNR